MILSASLTTVVVLWLVFTPAGLLGKTDAVGYSVCHQIPERSFHLLDRPLSLCARCTGQFLGALTALFYLALFGKKNVGWPPKPVMYILGSLVLVYAVDALNSYLQLYPAVRPYTFYSPDNSLRLITGIGLGTGLGILVWIIFQGVVWKEPGRGVPLQGNMHWAGLFLVESIMGGAILTRNPLLLYPLTLLSVFGVVFLLTLLYTMIWMIARGRENTFQATRDLTWFLLAGLLSAFIQIGVVDLLRYMLTGSWDGFPLG
jgi:uncharacterized membrane protein